MTTTYTVTIAPTSDVLTAAEDMILTAYAEALAGCRSLRLDADADLRRDLDLVAVALGHSAAAQLETEAAS
jgi:hypothetical protein